MPSCHWFSGRRGQQYFTDRPNHAWKSLLDLWMSSASMTESLVKGPQAVLSLR